MHYADVCIAGAGIIGLSLALELHHRGARVTVLERDTALSHASIAAAGMLAAHDPENPSQLQPLSDLSVARYPDFLACIGDQSGIAVPFQTSRTFQAHSSYTSDLTLPPHLTSGSHHFRLLDEHSVDPRQLAAALLAAVRNTTIRLLEHFTLHSAAESSQGMRLETSMGEIASSQLVHTQGAWSFAPVTPRKGQMLVIALPPELALRDVIRTPEIYIVPRTQGPRAGHALIGATVEENGFNVATYSTDLDQLRTAAAELLPVLADIKRCPTVDQWAGLRPATPDSLPILGRVAESTRQFIATGHYRNGILLAPATAYVLAQVVGGEPTDVDLAPFSQQRFTQNGKIAHNRRYSPTPS
jgi:glycine oxidase